METMVLRENRGPGKSWPLQVTKATNQETVKCSTLLGFQIFITRRRLSTQRTIEWWPEFYLTILFNRPFTTHQLVPLVHFPWPPSLRAGALGKLSIAQYEHPYFCNGSYLWPRKRGSPVGCCDRWHTFPANINRNRELTTAKYNNSKDALGSHLRRNIRQGCDDHWEIFKIVRIIRFEFSGFDR